MSRKPKNQPQKTVLIPAAKSMIPATDPNDLPASSLPIARHVAKRGDSPILASASAMVARIALGLSITLKKPMSVIMIPIITILQEPIRAINNAAPRRLRVASIKVMLLRAAAITGVCAKATCR